MIFLYKSHAPTYERVILDLLLHLKKCQPFSHLEESLIPRCLSLSLTIYIQPLSLYQFRIHSLFILESQSAHTILHIRIYNVCSLAHSLRHCLISVRSAILKRISPSPLAQPAESSHEYSLSTLSLLYALSFNSNSFPTLPCPFIAFVHFVFTVSDQTARRPHIRWKMTWAIEWLPCGQRCTNLKKKKKWLSQALINETFWDLLQRLCQNRYILAFTTKCSQICWPQTPNQSFLRKSLKTTNNGQRLGAIFP